jgi:hypothetical protein
MGNLFARELAVEIKRMIAPINDELRLLKARVAQLEAELETQPTRTRSRPGIAWKSEKNGRISN